MDKWVDDAPSALCPESVIVLSVWIQPCMSPGLVGGPGEDTLTTREQTPLDLSPGWRWAGVTAGAPIWLPWRPRAEPMGGLRGHP